MPAGSPGRHYGKWSGTSSGSGGNSSSNSSSSQPKFAISKTHILVLCLVAMVFFFGIHIGNFTLMSDEGKGSLISGIRAANRGLSSQQLRARVEELEKAIEASAAKLTSLSVPCVHPVSTPVVDRFAVSTGPDHRHPLHVDGNGPTTATANVIATPDVRQHLPPQLGGVIGQFQNHPILALSDEQLAHTPVSEMFGWYGESDGPGSCAGDFGTELVKRWRKTKATYCGSSSSGSSSGSSGGEGVVGQSPGDREHSQIDCYLVQQTRHHGNGDNLCVMRNVAVRVGLFGDDGFTRPVVQRYVDTRHYEQPYLKFPLGFIQAACPLVQDKWRADVMPGWNAALTTGAVQSVGSLQADEMCDEWVEHPVLVQQRDTFANFFHDSEDFFNVFLTMAILEWEPASTQLYLTDLYPKGPFWEMWSEVFSRGKPALTAWDLRNIFGQKRSKTNRALVEESGGVQADGFGKGAGAGAGAKAGSLEGAYTVCYRQLAIGIYGPAAPMTVASWDTPCRRTALVRAYSDYVIRGMGLQAMTHYAQASPSRTVVITYMARRASSEWPEKKFCSDSESFFLCRLWDSFGIRSLGRMVRNDQEVVSSLKAMEGETFANGARVKFQDVDFNLLTLKQQIQVDLETDVMVGPHGAGLMHNIFMRDRAALVELFVDGSSVNRHFHNLAFWFGRRYNGVQISNPIDVPQLVALLRKEVEAIDISKY